MDFRFTDDQLTLREAVRDYLAGTHGPEALREADATRARNAEVRDGLVEMGLAGIMVPEEHGGLGLGLIEAVMIAVELGRANVSEPLAEGAFVAVPWLVAAREGEWLEGIASGEKIVVPAEPANGWVLDLDASDAMVSGAGLDAPSPRTARVNSLDPLRHLFEVPPEARHDETLMNHGALIAAAQMVGAAERMLEMATAYAQERQQFGQPIGKFQAIKHHLADIAVKIEFARPVLWRAAMTADLPHWPVYVSHAKLAASDAAGFAAETAIQVHGAMGYTYEVDLHFWMKRTWALTGAWGSRAYHTNRIEQAVIGGNMPIGPAETFATKES